MGVINLIVFTIWPLGALLFSFKNYSNKWTKNIIWAFVVFYGYTFVLSNDTMDANRLKLKFEFFHQNNLDLTGVIKHFFIDSKEGLDIIQPIILYVTTLVTDNFQVLMAVLALVFGFFYSRNICYLMDRSEKKIGVYGYLFLWLFILVVGFWQINGFRFWTSAHIFFYATIPYVYEGSKKRLWLLAMACLLHFSFLLPTLVFIFFFFVKKDPKLFFYVFLASFLINSVNTETVGQTLINILPSNFESKINSYTSAEYAEEVFEADESTSAIMRKLMFVIINLFFVVFYFYYQKLIKDRIGLYRLFTFSILIMTVGNFTSLIPSGVRFLITSSLFSLSFLFLYIQTIGIDRRLRVLLQITAPFLILASSGYLRIGFNTMSELLIIGNPIIVFFIEPGRALIDVF